MAPRLRTKNRFLLSTSIRTTRCSDIGRVDITESMRLFSRPGKTLYKNAFNLYRQDVNRFRMLKKAVQQGRSERGGEAYASVR